MTDKTPFSDQQLDAAIAALSRPERISAAQTLVASRAPQLQRVLGEALDAGGWFGDVRDTEVMKAALVADPEERLTALKTLLSEETRLGMLVGVAVGFALAQELVEAGEEDSRQPGQKDV